MRYNPDIQASTQKAFVEALVRLGNKFKNIVVLDSNLNNLFGLQSFKKIFPERYFNFGNCIQSLLGAATGFSLRGKIPFVCTYAGAASGADFELVRNFVAQPNLNVKIVGGFAGLLEGPEGALRQSFEDIGVMRLLPNMKVICPADSVETRKVVEMMLLDYGPTYLRLYSMPMPELHDVHYQFEFGKGKIYKAGSDVCIFAYGSGVHTALEAANLLDRKDISTMVVNVASLKPLDEGLIVECARQMKYVVTVEDHHSMGGLGSAVSEVLAHHYPARVLRLGIEGFGESGRVDDLYRKFGLDGEGICESTLQWMKTWK